MPTISPDLIPTISPGNIFSRLTTDSSLNIRFLTATDPAYFEVINRPIADSIVRQLIIAKALDAVNLRLGHQALFPFLIQSQFTSGTTIFDLPGSWIWDMNVSMPKKWEKARLAKIKRVSGTNTDIGTGTEEFTGKLRLVFTAQEEGSTTEVSVFQADYQIDSDLTYQRMRIDIPSSSEEATPLPSGETETVDGFVTFRTLDTTTTESQTFFGALDPPTTTTTDSSGEYTSPAVYQIVDTVAGGANVTDDFDTTAISHGTGLLVDSATNPIPALDSDALTWLNTFNYPFRLDATRASASPGGITIPQGLFQEFNITVPASDQPTDDTTGAFSPVWVSKITRDDASSDQLTFTFSTFNITNDPQYL